MDEMLQRYRGLVFSAEPPAPAHIADPAAAYAHGENVTPGEPGDPFCLGDWRTPRYIAEFAPHNRPRAFHSEVVAAGACT
jgi:hypothetical protein